MPVLVVVLCSISCALYLSLWLCVNDMMKEHSSGLCPACFDELVGLMHAWYREKIAICYKIYLLASRTTTGETSAAIAMT